MLDVHPLSETAAALKALLVEDDDLDAQILKAYADMNGECAVHFTRAYTVGEAVQLTRDGRFDLYFVDLRLGDRSSLRLLADLADSGARPIVLSNISPQEANRYRLNVGGLRFLPKGDVNAGRLRVLVSEALRERDEARERSGPRCVA